MKNNGYIAIMHSENYTWIAYGSSEENAKKAIVKEWNNQRKSCYWMEHATVKKLDEYYGINVIEAINGKCEAW